MELQRTMTALKVAVSSPPGTVFPDGGLPCKVPDGGAAALARLARLEAGEPVVVSGRQVGLAQDNGAYCLEADGRLTPVEGVYADISASVRTVRNWRRPDGSLLRP